MQVNVIDDGHRPIPDMPTERNARGDFRGMGLFLIRALMDEVEFKSLPNRNETQMVIYLQR